MAKFYFYYSAMNAGKTTNLLQSAYNYRERGMRPLILQPQVEVAQGAVSVSSRIGLHAKARQFGPGDNAYTLTCQELEAGRSVDCVLIDEAQFLSKEQVWQLSEVVDELGIPVLAYGLRTDFRGEPFEGSTYLLAWADNIVELKTICASGSKATMVVRVDDEGKPLTEGPQVEIGGNERYISVSRKEYKTVTRGEAKVDLLQTQFDWD
ncbi:MAG: thymidine kinase [Pseudomonadota bacterium]